MDSTEKTLKISEVCEQEIDGISALPEKIRRQILGLLSTKQAVATTVLSSKWKNLLPFPSDFDADIKIDFDDTLFLNPKKEDSDQFDDETEYISESEMRNFFEQHLKHESRMKTIFEQFVNNVFTIILRNVSSISEVRLRCRKEYDDVKIDSWVRAAVGLNVKKLSVNVYQDRRKASSRDSSFLVGNLNGCKTITSLKLGGDFGHFLSISVPQDLSLPSLKELIFDGIDFRKGGGDIENFLKGCPKLVKLSICGMECQWMRSVSISCPLLEYLKLYGFMVAEECEIVLDVPQVKTFIYVGEMAENYVIKSPMVSLDEARIDAGLTDMQKYTEEKGSIYYPDHKKKLAELLAACSNAKTLYLSRDTIEAIQRVRTPLQAFARLTKVTFDRLSIAGWKFLGCLLGCAPNLERLFMAVCQQNIVAASYIKLQIGFYDYRKGFVKFESALCGVPMCLSSRMKEINIWAYEATEDEMKLLEYFLKYSKLLETMTVHTEEPELVKKRLLDFPRLSKKCEIVIDEVPGNCFPSYLVDDY